MIHSKRKISYTVIAVVLLVVLYSMIFYLSAEDAESSSVVSSKVTEFIFHIYYKITGGGGGEAVTEPVALLPLEALIRKLAHFLEYMCVGLLSYSLVVLWSKPAKLGSLLVILQLVISAGLDEFHQSFVPGRYASVKDVVIDTAGGIAGIFMIMIGTKIRNCWRKGK